MLITVKHGSPEGVGNPQNMPLNSEGKVQMTHLANAICRHVGPSEKIKIFHTGSLVVKESAALLASFLFNADYLEVPALAQKTKPEEQLRRTYELLLFAKEEGLGHVGIFLCEEKLTSLLISHYLKLEHNLHLKHQSKTGFGRGFGVNLELVPTHGKNAFFTV